MRQMTFRPREVPVHVGQELTVEVAGFGDGADALCRIGDYVMFVAGGLPGERLLVRVTSASRKFGRGDLLRVEQAAEDRVEPHCAHFGHCGGCQLQHVAYEAQLAAKLARLQKDLHHVLGFAPTVLPILAPKEPWQTRTRMLLVTVGQREGLVAGMFAARSRELVPIAECPVTDRRGFSLAVAARDAASRAGVHPWEPYSDRGDLRAILVRMAPGTGESAVTLIMRETPPPPAVVQALSKLATIVAWNRNDGEPDQMLGRRTLVLHGPPRIRDEVAGARLLLSPTGYGHASAFGASALVATLREQLSAGKKDRVLDLYSGSGLFSLAVADRVAEVVSVEDNEVSIADLNASIAAGGIKNVRPFHGRVERAVFEMQKGDFRPATVIMDPPPGGADGRALGTVARDLKPRRILHVASDPEGLEMDLTVLARHGYAIEAVQPIDALPQTHALTMVTVLERRLGGRDFAPSLSAAKRLLKKSGGKGP
jgi:23S rRNA (uracil1939-C5)-methyltransferase